jgi:hypothetical protein
MLSSIVYDSGFDASHAATYSLVRIAARLPNHWQRALDHQVGSSLSSVRFAVLSPINQPGGFEMKKRRENQCRSANLGRAAWKSRPLD